MNDAAASLFAGIVADKAEHARQALAAVPQAYISQWLDNFRVEAESLQARSLKDRIAGFRASVGEEPFLVIASGESLAAMIEVWEQGEKLSIGERALDCLLALAAAHPSEQTLGREEAAAFFGELLITDRTSDSDTQRAMDE